MPWGNDRVAQPPDKKASFTVGQMVKRDVSGWGKDPPANSRGKDVLSSALSGLSDLKDQAVDLYGHFISPGPGVQLPGPLAKAQLFSPQDGLRTVNALAAYAVYGSKAKDHLAQQNAISQYQPQTAAGRLTKTAVVMTPNALLGPGGAIRRGAQVVIPTLTSEGARGATEAAGGGPNAQKIASVAGAVVGGLAAGTRVVPRGAGAPAPVADNALSVFASKTKPDLAAMQQRAANFRRAGINPTLTDVTDETGRGFVRAAASRMTPARQRAQDFADRRALDLPSRISRQAQRTVSSDPRTPAQIQADLVKARSATADTQYGAVRDNAFTPTPEAVEALRTPAGRAAIKHAAEFEANPDTRAALNRLADVALDHPSEPMTVGMADTIARALNDKGAALSRSGENWGASQHFQMAQDVRGAASNAVPAYGEAVSNYSAGSKLVDAADMGEGALNHNTDEFVARLAKMSPEEVDLARATARRAIERKSGESVGAAPGVARAIAEAPEQQARNAALLGPQGADELQHGMRMEELAVRNARDVAPRTGPQTFSRAQDTVEVAGHAAQIAGKLARADGIGAAIDGARLWLKSRNLSDAQAEELVKIATDPARTQEAFQMLQARVGAPGARMILKRLNGPRARNAALAGALAVSASTPQQEQ